MHPLTLSLDIIIIIIIIIIINIIINEEIIVAFSPRTTRTRYNMEEQLRYSHMICPKEG